LDLELNSHLRGNGLQRGLCLHLVQLLRCQHQRVRLDPLHLCDIPPTRRVPSFREKKGPGEKQNSYFEQQTYHSEGGGEEATPRLRMKLKSCALNSYFVCCICPFAHLLRVCILINCLISRARWRSSLTWNQSFANPLNRSGVSK
jgi:hypothetical protein